MLNYKTSIKGDVTYSDLVIREIKPIMKLIFKQIMENQFGNSVWKLEKNSILLLMEPKQCTY